MPDYEYKVRLEELKTGLIVLRPVRDRPSKESIASLAQTPLFDRVAPGTIVIPEKPLATFKTNSVGIVKQGCLKGSFVVLTFLLEKLIVTQVVLNGSDAFESEILGCKLLHF